jgi:hypothetical protein
MGQKIQPHEAKEAAAQFETGHVCRNCESQLMCLPDGGDYYWCPTCGVETHGNLHDICVCGSHVGKHDALLRCACNKSWANEVNLLVRRKVAVVPRPQAPAHPAHLTPSRSELFDEVDD